MKSLNCVYNHPTFGVIFEEFTDDNHSLFHKVINVTWSRPNQFHKNVFYKDVITGMFKSVTMPVSAIVIGILGMEPDINDTWFTWFERN